MPRAQTNGTAIAAGGGLGGAIATVIAWAAKQFWQVEIPGDVAAAMATILVSAGGLVASLIKR